MKKLLAPVCLCLTLLCSLAARAELQDEIQVYDDSINAPGEYGLELHVNTTPSGRGLSNYAGEVAPLHGLRFTPEFSYGLSRDIELGLYLPMVKDANDHYDLAGVKLRLKWLPLQAPNGRGWFGGVNLELSRLAKRYSESRSSVEARFIMGYRNPDWLLAFNPILGFDLSDGLGGDRPDFSAGFKVARKVNAGLAAGFEYYSSTGKLGQALPWDQQDNRLYLALDVDMKPWVFNVGIGRGLTAAADGWTLKTIFEIPFN